MAAPTKVNKEGLSPHAGKPGPVQPPEDSGDTGTEAAHDEAADGEAAEAGRLAEATAAAITPAEAVPKARPAEGQVAESGTAQAPEASDPVQAEAATMAGAVATDVPPAPADADGEWDEEVTQGRDLSSWAIVGIVFGIIVLVTAAIGVLVTVTHGFHHKTVVKVKYKVAAVYRLHTGECVNTSANGLSVTVVSCSVAHQSEVFATFDLTGSAWPGAAAIQQDSGNGCSSRLAGYLNPDFTNAGLTQEFVYPNQSAWTAGVRTVVCEVSAANGNDMTGSVRKTS